MSQQLSCCDMCKFVTWLDHKNHNYSKDNFRFPSRAQKPFVKWVPGILMVTGPSFFCLKPSGCQCLASASTHPDRDQPSWRWQQRTWKRKMEKMNLNSYPPWKSYLSLTKLMDPYLLQGLLSKLNLLHFYLTKFLLFSAVAYKINWRRIGNNRLWKPMTAGQIALQGSLEDGEKLWKRE